MTTDPIPPPHEPFTDNEERTKQGKIKDVWYRFLASVGSWVGHASKYITFFGFTGAVEGGANANPTVQLHSTEANLPAFSLYEWRNAASGRPEISFCRSRGATIGTHTILQDTASVGTLSWHASDGVDFQRIGHVTCRVSGTPAVNDMPGLVAVGVNAPGGTSSDDTWFFTPDGHFVPATNTVSNVGSSSSRVNDVFTDGVLFNGDSAAANRLDDYEEGTWTPTYFAAGTDFTSVTYDSSREGTYTKIGNLVYIKCFLMTDAITVGSAAGAVRIGGLPFTPGGTNAHPLSLGFVGSFGGDMPDAASAFTAGTIGLYYRTTSNGGSIDLDASDLGTGANANRLELSGCYTV